MKTEVKHDSDSRSQPNPALSACDSGNYCHLWIFGNNIKDTLGHFCFAVFYFACGIAAALAETLAAPSSRVPMIGASGAIAGVLGAYLFLYPKARVQTLLFLGYFIRSGADQAIHAGAAATLV